MFLINHKMLTIHQYLIALKTLTKLFLKIRQEKTEMHPSVLYVINLLRY